jgi:hypothetical protein
MSALDSDEFNARLSSLSTGPWTQSGKFAFNKLKKGYSPSEKLLRQDELNLLSLGPFDTKAIKIDALDTVLRWHGEKGISDSNEIKFRDSLDDALVYPQLLELAVETGYLPLEQVSTEARRSLASLLWAGPVRNYVGIYAYLGVDYLANRTHVTGLTQRNPPPVDERAAILFSAFVATLRQIEADTSVLRWRDFLDDYIMQENEQNKFYAFLENSNEQPSRRFEDLIVGAIEFSVVLADFFSMANKSQKERFGLFHSYWLAKLFGYVITKDGYARNQNIWGDGDNCWARILCHYLHRIEAHDMPVISDANTAKQFCEANEILREVWDLVRAFIREARHEEKPG